MGWIGDLVQWGVAYRLVTAYTGHVLLVLVALGVPTTMWALHRSPRVRWRFGARDVLTLAALAVYLVLLVIGAAITFGWA